MGCAQLIARVAPSSLATQPLAVEQLSAPGLDVQATVAQQRDRLPVQRVGVVPRADQRTRTRLDAPRPGCAARLGVLAELVESAARQVGLVAPNRSLHELWKRRPVEDVGVVVEFSL